MQVDKSEDQILITGGSGMLGSNIAMAALENFEVYTTYHSHPTKIPGCHFIECDIRNRDRVTSIVKDIQPNLIIHTAALTNVDYCEEHPEEAGSINVIGTENVISATKETGAKLIYISTDSVFDGKKGMYTEEDTPNPLNVYAKTKLEGEKRSLNLSNSIVVRTNIYGWSLYDKLSIAEWILAGLREGKTLRMFTDVFFCPILVNNFIDALFEMYSRDFVGLYHLAGGERCSKHSFAYSIAKIFRLDEKYIEPSTLNEINLLACRPKDPSLDTTKASKELQTVILGVDEGIRSFKRLEHKPIQRFMK